MLQKPPLVRKLSPRVVQMKDKESLIHLSTGTSKPNVFPHKRSRRLNLLWCFCSKSARCDSTKAVKRRLDFKDNSYNNSSSSKRLTEASPNITFKHHNVKSCFCTFFFFFFLKMFFLFYLMECHSASKVFSQIRSEVNQWLLCVKYNARRPAVRRGTAAQASFLFRRTDLWLRRVSEGASDFTRT